MAEELNYNQESNRVADRLQAILTKCHNILRSQEGLSAESAFRELNKLLFVKLFSEGFGDYLPREYEIQESFELVKRRFSNERLFNDTDTINVSPRISMDVLGTMSDLKLLNLTTETGRGYEEFVQKVLRGYGDVPIISKSVVSFVESILKTRAVKYVADPSCGYGGLLSGMASLPQTEKDSLRLLGYEKDQLMVQTAKLNLILHGESQGRIERISDTSYYSEHQFEIVVTCVKTASNAEEDIEKALRLLVREGIGVFIVPDDILQKEQYYYTRKNLLRHSTILTIVSLPVGAIRLGNKQQKTSILILKAGLPQYYNARTLFAQVENIGVSTFGLPTEKNDFMGLVPVLSQWIHSGAYKDDKQTVKVTISEMENWNVSAEFIKRDNFFMSRYPLRKLGEIVEMWSGRSEELNEDEYKQVTVRKNWHDVVLRSIIKSKDIKNKSRQTIIRKGQILISRIDAKNGAIGIVPDFLDGAIVSDNYIALEVICKDIDKYYLLMVLTSDRYQKLLSGISRGITPRSYIKNIDLLGIEIPVPDLQVQRSLTGNLEEKQEQIKKLEKDWNEGIKSFSEKLFGL